MVDYDLPSKLLSHLSIAAEHVRSHDFIHIFSHHDADGVAAGRVLACMLQRLDIEYQVTFVPVMNDEVLLMMRDSHSKCILMSDIGASYVDQLEGLEKDVIVLDHHNSDLVAGDIIYINPHLYGIDGMTSGCGSTLALMLAVTVDENNWDLVRYAFAGLAGDRQLINGFSGLNAYIGEEAKKRGYISVIEGSLIPPGTLSQSLYISTEPYVRGIGGSSVGVKTFLDEAGIDQTKDFLDLTDDEKHRLSSMIAVKLLAQGVSVQTLEETARTRYALEGLGMDAETLSDLFNACGREKLGGIGVGICLGNKDSLAYARELNYNSKKDVIEATVELDRRKVTPMENIQFFDSTASGFTGILCSIVMHFIGDPDKPTIGINFDGEVAKASARGTWDQLDRGIDLSVAMRTASESVGGQGGGHRIASGANFPSIRGQEFLKNLDEIIGKQLISHAK